MKINLNINKPKVKLGDVGISKSGGLRYMIIRTSCNNQRGYTLLSLGHIDTSIYVCEDIEELLNKSFSRSGYEIIQKTLVLSNV